MRTGRYPKTKWYEKRLEKKKKQSMIIYILVAYIIVNCLFAIFLGIRGYSFAEFEV